MSIKVFKVRLTGDQKIYWLTERQGADLMAKWEAGVNGVTRIGGYDTMVKVSSIRQIYAETEEEPYPREFKQSLARESGGKLIEVGKPSVAKLPTATLFLRYDGDAPDSEAVMQIDNRPATAIEKNSALYWVARCHYKASKNEREYFTKFSDLETATLVALEDGGWVAKNIFHYGAEVAC